MMLNRPKWATIGFLIILFFTCVAARASFAPDPAMMLGSVTTAAHNALAKQIQYWTETERIEAPVNLVGEQGEFKSVQQATVHLTYLSPQLIEAVLRYRRAVGGASNKDIASLRDEVRKNMKEQGRVPFILTVDTADLHPSYRLDLGLPEGTLALTTVGGSRYAPSEYDRILDSTLHKGHLRFGSIYFPYTPIEGTRLEIDQEPALTVRLDTVEFTSLDQSSTETADLAWNFNLLPVDFPLDAVADLGAQEKNLLPENDVAHLVSAVVAVVATFE